MKLIGRAAFWLIDKIIYLLIGNKDFTFTPEPDEDDWPPDGSMHFLRLDGRYRPTYLPPNIVQYEFGANVGEDDPIVFVLGWEMIFRLCESRQTLIKCKCLPEYTKSLHRKPATRSLEIVTEFLRSQISDAPIAQREESSAVLVAAVLSDGCPRELFSQYQEMPDILGCHTFFYLFSEENTPLDPEEGLSMVKQGLYQAELYLSDGPNSLNVVFDPETLDIAEVEKVVAEVCHAHNILLADPFSPPEIKE